MSTRRTSGTRMPAVDARDFALAASRKPQRRKGFLVAFILSTLFLAFFLILQVQRGASLNPFGHWTQPAQVNKSDASFKLHAEDHAFRDPTTQTFAWRVTAGQRRPDGVLKRVYLINDAFPGPTIEARSGDRLVIHLENALEDGEQLSLHCHGLSMRGANEMDGASGITQAPIPSGTTFTYNFTIDPDQHGTFWYHSHFAEQRADGLYGGLVVHKPESDADAIGAVSENLLLVGDWYHRTAVDALEYYMHPGAFGLETVPDSILVNGEGNYRCSDAVPARPVDCQNVERMSMSSLRLELSKENVVRIVNVGAYAGFEVSVPGTVLTVLTVDGGHDVKGSAAKTVGFLHPGERMNLLVQPISGYAHYETELIVTLDESPFKYDNMALNATHSFPLQWIGEQNQASELEGAVFEKFDIQDIQPAQTQSHIFPEKAHQTIVLYTLTQKLAHLENEPHGFINNTM